MYEKHIARLQAKLTGSGDEELHVAIALMRAAEPKDEAAEREHCYTLFADTMLLDKRPWAEIIMRERAAARAEGYAAGKRDAQKPLPGWDHTGSLDLKRREREHATAVVVVENLQRPIDPFDQDDDRSAADVIERERADARAEVEAKYAAEPKDEAAERKLCAEITNRYVTLDTWLRVQIQRELFEARADARAEVEAKYAAMLAPKDGPQEQTVCDAYACCMEGDPLNNSPHVREARAAARAEGYAAGSQDDVALCCELQTKLAAATEKSDRLNIEADELCNKLTAATARIERQEHSLKLMSQLGNETEKQLRAKLKTANARIAELETSASAFVTAATTRIEVLETALTTVREAAARHLEDTDGLNGGRLYAAIEASKK